MIRKIEKAYILAGGLSRRMGRDKLFVQINGRTVIENIINLCRAYFTDVTISANDAMKFEAFKVKVIPDYPNAQGPLGGIMSSLVDCRETHDTCFITAADLIDVDGQLIESLLKNYRDEEYFGVRERDFLQPLCGIYSISALPTLISCVESIDFRAIKAIEKLRNNSIPPTSEHWRNLNNMADLEMAEKLNA
ncbi:MAG: molybdenum cofactor guanylyltransferase [candidate division Zixibacteria bacterium]|nr:molybdenum cofactor guanylyltransferase [candidate division Zixibacteria bacterium]